MALPDLDARRIVGFHDALLTDSPDSPDPDPDRQRFAEGPWHWIECNHLSNARLWDEEDEARRTDVSDAEIVRCKRSIDRWNQRRNDAVEALDDCLLAALGTAGEPAAGARLHSETPGAMIDRLSILSLKIHHMRREAQRVEAGSDHTRTCAAKLERLVVQREDLRDCLDRLLDEVARGEACFRLYRQFKMYNDPALNPRLYRNAAGARARSSTLASRRETKGGEAGADRAST